MDVGGECVRDAESTHENEGNAVGEPPFLVLASAVESKSFFEQRFVDWLNVVTFFLLEFLNQFKSFGAATKSRITVANLKKNSPVKNKNRPARGQLMADELGACVQRVIPVLQSEKETRVEEDQAGRRGQNLRPVKPSTSLESRRFPQCSDFSSAQSTRLVRGRLSGFPTSELTVMTSSACPFGTSGGRVSTMR